MVFGASAFKKTIPFLSVYYDYGSSCIWCFMAFDAPKVPANLPTPYGSVWERINIGVFLIWIVVLAIVVLKNQNKQDLINSKTQLGKKAIK